MNGWAASVCDAYANWERGARKHAAGCAQWRLEQHEFEASKPEPPVQRQAVPTDAEFAREVARLDRRIDDVIARIDELTDDSFDLAERAGKAVHEHDLKIKRALEEIASLRVDGEILRAHKQGRDVIDLIRKDSHAA